MGCFAKYVRKWQFELASKVLTAYHFKYVQNCQILKSWDCNPPPTHLPIWKAYPTPGVGGRFEIFFTKKKRKDELKYTRSNLTPFAVHFWAPGRKLFRGLLHPLRGTRLKTIQNNGKTNLCRSTRIQIMIRLGCISTLRFVVWNDLSTHKTKMVIHFILSFT